MLSLGVHWRACYTAHIGLPIPGFVFKIAFGEAATILLEGQKAYPQRLLDLGFASATQRSGRTGEFISGSVTEYMRLWSIHPRYLDTKGLTAVWREGLLAQKVLQGGTRGYRNHPQLQRFRVQSDPLASVAAYLSAIYTEAEQRGYHFDPNKLPEWGDVALIPVTRGQMDYEWKHLLAKFHHRDPARYNNLIEVVEPEPHPLFIVIEGDVERWEILR